MQVLVQVTVRILAQVFIAQTVDNQHHHVAGIHQWLCVQAFQRRIQTHVAAAY
jgi:hypothetical protein